MIVFATSIGAPELQASDQLAAAALEKLGVKVIAAPWNSDQALFQTADLIVLRSTWDYHRAPQDFRRWLDSASEGSRVINAADLVKWNMSKDYLFSLREAGACLPPTFPISPTVESVEKAIASLGVNRVVIKPVIDASASGLSTVERGDAASIKAAVARLGGDGLVQPVIAEIETRGETSIIFFDGEFSHAVVKRPKKGDIRVQAEHGGVAQKIDPPDWALYEAERILHMLPQMPVYARIDVIILDDRMLLMEVEVIEPELFFTHAPEAADRFVAALQKRLK